MDPRTGRVYAVVNQEWALRRGWVPASTMKLVTGLAGVGEGLFDPAEKMRVQGRDLTRQTDRNTLPVMGRIWPPEAVAPRAITSGRAAYGRRRSCR